MGRPRKATDEQVFLAAQRVMARVGPSELTLAMIAEEAGVTAGALVQRFGSKRDLMLRMSEAFAGGMGELFAQLRAAHTPIGVIRAYAIGMAEMAVTPEALARNLAYLQADLSDPDLRSQLLLAAKETRRELLSLVNRAKKNGELIASTPAGPLVRNIEAIVSGALLTWAFHREGDAASWMRAHVDALLAPYRVKSRRKKTVGSERAHRH